jgi:hypothetical protein
MTRVVRLRSFLVSILFCLISTYSYGLDLKNVAMFGLGFASGTIFHEAGHAAAFWSQGGKVTAINFQSVYGKFDTNDPNLNRKRQITSLAGYTAQSLATEVIFQNKNWHKNNYALGWMSLGIFVNSSNPIRYYIFGQTDNDLGFYEKAGGDPLIPALLMIAHSGFTLYRIFSDTDIPAYLGNNTLGFNFKF